MGAGVHTYHKSEPGLPLASRRRWRSSMCGPIQEGYFVCELVSSNSPQRRCAPSLPPCGRGWVRGVSTLSLRGESLTDRFASTSPRKRARWRVRGTHSDPSE